MKDVVIKLANGSRGRRLRVVRHSNWGHVVLLNTLCRHGSTVPMWLNKDQLSQLRKALAVAARGLKK